jgi:hypothetical protein
MVITAVERVIQQLEALGELKRLKVDRPAG